MQVLERGGTEEAKAPDQLVSESNINMLTQQAHLMTFTKTGRKSREVLSGYSWFISYLQHNSYQVNSLVVLLVRVSWGWKVPPQGLIRNIGTESLCRVAVAIS